MSEYLVLDTSALMNTIKESGLMLLSPLPPCS